MSRRLELLRLLADGEPHPGTALAAQLEISRAAVWERIEGLRGAGVRIDAIAGAGYRLARPMDLLDSEAIRAALAPAASGLPREVVVHEVTDSTNQRLLDLSERSDIHGVAHLAELQTQGRGRHGQRWIAPLGGGLCLSLGWRFAAQHETFAALSLMVGLSAIGVLTGVGAGALGIKWPNDIVLGPHKLGGILIELRAELGGPTTAVIGIGVNVDLPDDILARIDQPCTDLYRVIGRPVSRNQLAARLIEALCDDLAQFERGGFDPWFRTWRQHDVLHGERVRVELPDRALDGIAEGIDAGGALLLRQGAALTRCVSGRVSRLA